MSEKTNKELFDLAYANAHWGAAELQKLVGMQPTRVQVADVVRILRNALAAAMNLESRLAGNPPPPIGETNES